MTPSEGWASSVEVGVEVGSVDPGSDSGDLPESGRAAALRTGVGPVRVTATIDVGEGLIYAMAAVDDFLYVLTGSGGVGERGLVSVIDTATNAVVRSLDAGSTPFDLAAGDGLLYVGNLADGVVSVIDPVSAEATAVIPVGPDPLGLALDGDRLYVAHGTGTVSVTDLRSRTPITQIAVAGEPFAVAVHGDRVCVTNYGGRLVAVIDVPTLQVVDPADKDLAKADPTEEIACARFAATMGGRLYVANPVTGSLAVVDGAASTVVDVHPATSAVDAIPDGAAPVDVVISGDRIYIGNLGTGTIVALDTETDQIVQTVDCGVQPGLMTASVDGRTLYVADVTSATVKVISASDPLAS